MIKRNFLNYDDAKNIVRKFNINSQKEWVGWCKLNKISGIPTNPNVIYKNNGWVSLSEWLGITSYKSARKVKYISYEDCKEFVNNELHINTRSEWYMFDKQKLPIEIPKRPDYFYKKTNDWISWEDFLNSNLSPRSKSKIFLSFGDAKELLRELKFKDQYEYIEYLSKNKIDFLPKRPDSAYKNNGWKGYLDYLECSSNVESIGERIIKTFLENNKIPFEKEKTFDGCSNLKKLRFDFYLPDHNICIEYDGILHYKSNILFGGEEQFKKQKRNDKIKNKWCKKNNIRLLRIPYLKISKISEILKTKILDTV